MSSLSGISFTPAHEPEHHVRVPAKDKMDFTLSTENGPDTFLRIQRQECIHGDGCDSTVTLTIPYLSDAQRLINQVGNSSFRSGTHDFSTPNTATLDNRSVTCLNYRSSPQNAYVLCEKLSRIFQSSQAIQLTESENNEWLHQAREFIFNSHEPAKAEG